MKGIVRWFSMTKRYGFIVPADGSKDVFVHINDVKDAGLKKLNEGDRVEYETGEGKGGGKCAKHIRMVAASSNESSFGQHEGTVRWFDAKKGYGFITTDVGGTDIFVHLTIVQQAGLETLVEGERLSFDTASFRGKISAAKLRLLDRR